MFVTGVFFMVNEDIFGYLVQAEVEEYIEEIWQESREKHGDLPTGYEYALWKDRLLTAGCKHPNDKTDFCKIIRDD
jgi:hypothetical protein